MDRFSRIVLGYHGCHHSFAEGLIRGEIPIRDWKPSKNSYDWLGHGIYFWEHGPRRALGWGKGKKTQSVVGAIIGLGNCLDLTDVRYTDALADQYEVLRQLFEAQGLPLPKNSGKRRDLDCLVLNETVRSSEEGPTPFQTVRCPFLEGDPAFPGSAILRESHIQLVVREKAVEDSILGVFRPQ